jgi:uncharacterized protein (TIGR02996 family)
MPVHFVYRCHHGAPSEKHLRTFPQYDTVLAWAQGVFRQIPDHKQAFAYAAELLGGLDVHSFGSMFAVGELYPERARPETMDDVSDWFGRMYDQGQANGPHHVQLLTDDDEIEMAVYVFDDHFVRANPGKADFLLLPSWALPGGGADGPALEWPNAQVIEPSGTGEGAVFGLALYADCSSNLEDLNAPTVARGVRLPDLARWLLTHPDEDELCSAFAYLREWIEFVLRAPEGEDAGFLKALRDTPAERTTWGAYSDWLNDRGLPVAGVHLIDRALRADAFKSGRDSRKHALDVFKATDHMAQISRHEGRWPDEPMMWFTPSDTFAQFLYFDDRWCAAHPELARAVLTFASRWDALS